MTVGGSNESKDVFQVIWSSLDARTRNILQLRLVGFTLEDVGQDVGLTRERIRQIEKEGIHSLNFLVSSVFPALPGQIEAISDEICAVPQSMVAELLVTECTDGVAVFMQGLGFSVCKTWGSKVTGWWTKSQKKLSTKLDIVIRDAPFKVGELSERLNAAGLPADFPVEAAIASSGSGLVMDVNDYVIRKRSKGADAAYLWLTEQAEAAGAEEIASGISIASVRSLTEAMRRDKERFIQIRPEGTWAIRDWSTVDGPAYGNATEAVIAVLREMGPLTWQQVTSETMRRYPVTPWRISQCQFSWDIGITEDGRYDLFERGAQHVVPSEPSIPEYMAHAGQTVALRMPVNSELLRGSGLGAHVWLTWKLGLYFHPSERIFSVNQNGESGRVVVRRNSSGAGISSLRGVVVAMGLKLGCSIVVVFELEESTVKVRHGCGYSCPNSVAC